MIVTWLSSWLSIGLSLTSGFLTWTVVLSWLWQSGWKIQRRYFIKATQKPLTRNAIVWSVGIVGAIFFVAVQVRPGMPGVMTVAMTGVLSAHVGARTHRLLNAHTVATGIGVALGVIIGGVISPLWQKHLLGALIGMLIWFVPIALLNRLPGGMGGGNVKLAPVLGALVGSVGLHAALSALAPSLVSADVTTLWRIVVGSAGTKTRVPMGPWMIGAAPVGTVAWGVVPDWLQGPAQVLSWTTPGRVHVRMGQQSGERFDAFISV